MSELRSLVHAARRLRAAGESFLLATLVSVTGSSYRRPGARLIIARDRWMVGSVSGGCLERDLVRRAWWNTEKARAAVVTYDSTGDDDGDSDGDGDGGDRDDDGARTERAGARQGVDLGWGIGLGCNGIVELLVERMGGDVGPANDADPADAGETRAVGGRDSDARGAPAKKRDLGHDLPGPGHLEARPPIDALAFIARCLADERRGVLVTAFRVPGEALPLGTWVAVRDGEPPLSALPPRFRLLEETVVEEARALLAGGSATAPRALGDGTEMLVELIEPPPHLFIFGAGPDAVPVVRAARAVGFAITVWAPQSRADALRQLGDADQILSGPAELLRAGVVAAHRPVAVVMSHNADRDREALGMLLGSPCRYIGVLGPRRRTERLLAGLPTSGASPRLAVESMRRLHAPVGLAIGAETPDEIALSIVAEVQAVLAGEAAGSLSHRVGAIHRATTSLSMPAPARSGARATGGE
jgi:xanthine dehydrogenase accessory factor